MSGHETLKAWQHARRLALVIRRVTKLFPQEEWRLADQWRRAADSIVLNIAEGSGRGTNREFRRYLEAARGSMKEVEAGRTLAFDADLVGPKDRRDVQGLICETARTLYGLLRSVCARIERGELDRQHRKNPDPEGSPPP
jgi:four helix bundle protein